MDKATVHLMFLCFLLSVLVTAVASDRKLFTSRRKSESTGAKYIQSATLNDIDFDLLRSNECKFYILRKTVFYACPKRPTRYPYKHNEVIDYKDDASDDRGLAFKSKAKKFECPFPFGTYPHPTDCRKYYLCVFDKPRTMSCKSSELYDEDKDECAAKSTVDCGDRTGDGSKITSQTIRYTTKAPKTTTKNYKTTTKRGGDDDDKKDEKFKCPYTWGTFPNPKDCSQYYLCLQNRPSLKKCKASQLYDTEDQECRDKDQVDCGSRFNPREETTASPKTTVASTVLPKTSVTAEHEITTSDIENSPSPKTSTDQDETDPTAPEEVSSSPEEVSSSPESRTTDKSDDEGTSAKDTFSPETTGISEDNTSDSDKVEFTSDAGSEELGSRSEFTAEVTSVSNAPDSTDGESSTSGESIITNDDSNTSKELVTASEGETSPKEPESTPDTITVSEGDVSSDSTDSEIKIESGTPSDEPQTKEDEKTTLGELQSSSPVESTPFDEEVSTNEENLSSTPFRITTETGNEETSSTPKILDSTTEDVIPSEESDLSSPDSFPTSLDDMSTPEGSTSSSSENTVSVDEGVSSEEPRLTTEVKEPSGKQQSVIYYTTPFVEPENTDEEKDTTHSEEPKTDGDLQDQSTTSDDKREDTSPSTNIRETTPDTSSEFPESFSCPKKKGKFPHRDCSLYYACREGKYTVETCSEGTLFDTSHSICNNEESVDCGNRRRPEQDQSTTSESKIEDTTPSTNIRETTPDTSSELPESFSCPKKKGKFPHRDCSLFYACREGKYTVETCSEGTLFDISLSICNNEESVDCGNRRKPDADDDDDKNKESSSSPAREAMEDSSTEATTSVAELFTCRKKKGNFADPVDCASYYECRDGVAELVKCSPGLLFSTEFAICYTADQVDCKSRKVL